MHTFIWYVAIIAYTLVTCLTASLAVSIYLHRDLTHKSIELHPIAFGFFRFVIWFITGMEPAEWKVVHLTHHRAPSDSVKDPHSPENEGMWKIVLFGVWYYIKACRELKTEVAEERKKSGDIWGRAPLRYVGILLNLAFNVWMWGSIAGPVVWAIQSAWIPFWAAGVINGIGHSADEKHEHTQDKSHDILSGKPAFLQNVLNVITGGESRHHAHHMKAGSARFTLDNEFDWGYTVILALAKLRLAKVLRE